MTMSLREAAVRLLWEDYQRLSPERREAFMEQARAGTPFLALVAWLDLELADPTPTPDEQER